MTAIALNLYGVTPMTVSEMRETDGGVDPVTVIIIVTAAAALLAGCATTPDKAEPASAPKQEPAPVSNEQAA